MTASDLVAALACARTRCKCAGAVRRGRGLTHCPGHGDDGPSLNVDDKGGTVVVRCHAGCPQEKVIAALRERGLWGSPTGKSRTPGQSAAPRGATPVASGPPVSRSPRYTTSFRIRDLDGELAAVHRRLEYEDGTKDFMWRRPDGQPGLNGAPATGLPLYRSETLPALPASAQVVVTEGEKAADRLASAMGAGMGVVATVTGASAVPRDDVLRTIAGRGVSLWPDNDAPGRQHMVRIAERLAALGCASIRVVHWPDAPAHGDAADYLASHTSEETTTLLGASQPLADRIHSDVSEPLSDSQEGPFDRLPAHPPAAGDEGSLGAIPDFPLQVLPAPARQLAESAQAGGMPAAYIAGSALAAIAIAIGPRAQIERPGWRQRAIVWPAIMGPPGSAKSPALGMVLRPLRDYDALHWNQEERDAAYSSKQRALDPTLLVGDTTMEALAERLVAGDGSAGIVRDELSQLLGSPGEYKRGNSTGDRGRLLELWAGEPVRVARVTRAPLLVQAPTVVIVGAMVPGDHHLLGGSSDGFRPRWLPHLAAFADPVTRAPSAPMTSAWNRLLTAELLPVRGEYRTWTLSAGAERAFTDAQQRWSSQARAHESESTSAALHKADVHLLRVALVLAEAESPGAGGQVAEDVIVRAVGWMEFVLDCWRALPEQGSLALSRREEVLDVGVEKLRAWLEEHGGEATRREIQRAHVAGCRTTGQLDALLEHYHQTYPETVATVANPRGPVATLIRAPYRLPATVAMSPVCYITPSGGSREIRKTGSGEKLSPNPPELLPPTPPPHISMATIGDSFEDGAANQKATTPPRGARAGAHADPVSDSAGLEPRVAPEREGPAATQPPRADSRALDQGEDGLPFVDPHPAEDPGIEL
jgi:hypothetical protein